MFESNLALISLLIWVSITVFNSLDKVGILIIVLIWVA